MTTPRPAPISYPEMLAELDAPRTSDAPHMKFGSAIIKAVTLAVAEHVSKQIEPLLERIKQLEAKPSPQWCGAHQSGKSYPALSFVVDRGALWISKTVTTTRPGADGSWQLCTKRGEAKP